ncbi:MAG: tRNA pseudouridine(55) synthase TruB [Candidatus Colwellbacteria bacterium RIFCSPHIGHO2_02_FULL_43_15]|uniref:tRNA pseudouridine synthase B n=1 Tax=Candidatus Colwellbacteria bacterium RIFCSPHIGHO2_02_FULL_43_15 TaxID=1797686 RepID=A0A1G1Z033_9BACT|nr:MAG: tRNA pseudouridine(55) synthase TruB [Candidatus Colwellbacteria bacterium RIFCSPHIGHO2_02_FULL_43_15]
MKIKKKVEDKEIVLIDKPKGPTSFDMVSRLRRKLGIRKIGHAGTLDPLASGLLILGVGKGTKKLADLIKLPKTYEAEILLGVSTDTGDLEGKVLKEQEIETLDIKEVKRMVKGLVGKLLLKVPAYSAIKVKGERLYKIAREGRKIDLPEKEMEVTKAVFKSCLKSEKHYVLKVVLDVKSGTYVRSLAEEIGRRLSVPATLKNLKRTKIGRFNLKDAEKIS